MSDYYPPVSFSFQVRIAGNRAGVDASFQEVSGLDAERPLIEVKEGGENRFMHRLPAQVRYGNLILKRGLMLANSPLFDWCRDLLESDFAMRVRTNNLVVSLLDADHAPVMSWAVSAAWPVKWGLSSFTATTSEVAIETMEFSFQRLERKVERPLGASGFARA